MVRLTWRTLSFSLALALLVPLGLKAASVDRDLEGIKKKIEKEKQGISQTQKKEGSILQSLEKIEEDWQRKTRELKDANAKLDSSGKYSVADVGVKELLSGAHPAENISVFPNDVITVPTAEMVFVIGEVKKPGEVALKGDGVTVLQALSSADGFGSTPAPQNSKIVRLMPGTSERKEIAVDLSKILAGKSEDIAMKPNDILVVPPSGPKRAAARAMEAAIQAATGIAIWRRP